MKASLRAHVLSEWRGLPQELARPERTKAISQAVKEVMLQLGLKERIAEEEILAAWKEMVGDFLAQHAIPASLKNGVLSVNVIQSTVRYELERVWKPELLKKLRARFGARTIREVKFRIG